MKSLLCTFFEKELINGIGKISEIEISTLGTLEQQRWTETKSIWVNIELHYIILHLMPSNHNRRSTTLPTIHETQTPHIHSSLLNPHHRITPEDSPEHFLAVHHQINGRNRGSHSCFREVSRRVAYPKGLNGLRHR